MLIPNTSVNLLDAISSNVAENNSYVDFIDYHLNPDHDGVLVNGTLDTPSWANFSNGTSSDEGEESLMQGALLAVVLSSFCFATIFGNVLVMVAVAREPYLHTVTNYFVASLATADLLVGAVVMPFCVVLEVGGGDWPFGRDWCDVWRSVDVLASTASILNLCVISLDRYWAITDAMSYPRRMSPPRARLLIALVWLCSALISFPAIAWWRAVSPAAPYPERACLFTEDVGYLVFSSAVSFYVPLSVMLVTYCRIYRAATEQKRSLKLGTKQVHASNGGGGDASLTLRIHRGGGGGNYSPKCANGGEFQSLREAPLRTAAKSFSLSRKISKLAKERKAAKTLGIVMGVFVVCWLPFFVTNVLMGVCGEQCVANSKLVFSVVTWLGWTNSGMNPVIYACWSRDFRRAFTKLLCGWWPGWRARNARARFRQVVRDEAHFARSHVVVEDISL
ncbi:hypothetical protein JTE90_021327 [Oedothorax gibbosus]|uniref:G-protein coupled receptors family 1 profile domain-containing protein n=1 Tax=Oedothorax gibbosus TaxID=931172 RepID=A0AAV6VP43_9ARAC|nr:hypothetical protein JTE90_021327 [Oedothorax gibbosus]